MKDTLKPGLESEFTFRVTDAKTVPALYPESPEFRKMPEVFRDRVHGRVHRMGLHQGRQSAS